MCTFKIYLQATASAADLSVEFYVVSCFARVGDSAAFSSVLFSLFAWYLFVRGGFLWMSAKTLLCVCRGSLVDKATDADTDTDADADADVNADADAEASTETDTDSETLSGQMS